MKRDEVINQFFAYWGLNKTPFMLSLINFNDEGLIKLYNSCDRLPKITSII